MASALPQNDAFFQILTANAADGIVVIDSCGKVRIFNATCEHLFGYRAEEVISRDVAMLMPAPHFENELEEPARRGNAVEAPIMGASRDAVGRRKDGSNFQMHLSVGEYTSGDEKMYIGTIHDLSSYRLAVTA